eukprot:TRINITY_DN32502_c0_g1_i1.p1 TRINITY_DN32502_c0_g1~~TRINITY_DN32502_c0_g1_i1.p1  ORF type:complete len:225 (+),score=87.10 TRINITY_DN32502_c0_g1_i1:89-676(+)
MPEDSKEGGGFLINKRDLLARFKYSMGFKMVYVVGVLLAAVLLLAALFGGEHVHNTAWYFWCDAVLTFLFTGEIAVHMWLTGPGRYFKESNTNTLEFLLCVACCMLFGLSAKKQAVRMEFETLLLGARYTAQLARLYYFVKTHNLHHGTHRKLRLHDLDNPGIVRKSTAESPSPRTAAPASPFWLEDEDETAELV